jgi:hypothetical protein
MRKCGQPNSSLIVVCEFDVYELNDTCSALPFLATSTSTMVHILWFWFRILGGAHRLCCPVTDNIACSQITISFPPCHLDIWWCTLQFTLCLSSINEKEIWLGQKWFTSLYIHSNIDLKHQFSSKSVHIAKTEIYVVKTQSVIFVWHIHTLCHICSW